MAKTCMVLALALLPLLGGCAKMMLGSFFESTAANLQQQTDIELVCEGTPAYLLLLDSMLAENPGDKKQLLTATQAFTGYATVLDACSMEERAKTTSTKAKIYGLALLFDADIGTALNPTPKQVEEVLAGFGKNDAERLFWAGNGWATWIQHQEGSPESLAQIVQVEQIMLRVLDLDETIYHGGAHLFLGAFYGAKPKMLGGNPQASREHFERALAIGKREFLPAQVLYARTYAKMVFDRDLFESLLREVIDFPLEQRPDIGLANRIARREAVKLLDQAEQFF